MYLFSRRLLAVLLLVVWNSACTSTGPSDDDAAITLRVMTFNIEWGGAKISFDNVVEAIRLSRADIVGIQEAEGNLQRLADELGWHYDLRNYVISRYPLFEPSGADGKFVYVEVAPGKIIAVANVHLWSDPYGPDGVRDGASLEEVLDMERAVRLGGIESYLSALAPLGNENTPLFLTGDFNAPSHLDWTGQAVGARQHLRYAVPWPVSQAMTAAGFQDSWRVVHPDPISNPGLTWWAGRPPLAEYQPTENDGQDRIDFVWYTGPVDAISSEIVGEPGGPEVSFAVAPWPSDHRGVVSEFRVVPVDTPEMVTTGQRVYRSAAAVDVAYQSSGETIIYVVNVDTRAPVFKQPVAPGASQWQLPAILFEPGHYQVQMWSATAQADLVKEFWVLARDAVPEVILDNDVIPGGRRDRRSLAQCTGESARLHRRLCRGCRRRTTTTVWPGLTWMHCRQARRDWMRQRLRGVGRSLPAVTCYA